jgi:hypothetical protein
MDFWIFVFYAVLVFVASLIGGFVAGLFEHYYLYEIWGRMNRIEKKLASGQAMEAKGEQSARISQAIARFAALQAEGLPMKDALIKVGLEFPDVAMSLMSKLGKGGLGGMDLGALLNG